jgi:D-threo-aldose 1-dehydrogenase
MKVDEMRTFERVPLSVTAVSYGGAPIGNLFRPITTGDARALVQDAWDHGIRYFDTAPMYGHGLSEHRLASVLLDKPRSEFVYSTKVGRTLIPSARGSFDSGAWVDVPPLRAEFDYSYDAAFRQLDQSLHRMMTDRVEIVFLHDADHYTHGTAQRERFEEAMAGTVSAMVRMREEGLVTAIGAGLNDADVLFEVSQRADLDCLLVAGRYTLLEQEGVKELLDLIAERRMSIIAGGVFNSGLLATGAIPGAKFNYTQAAPEQLRKVAAFEVVCRDFGVSLPAAAIQFVGAHPSVVSVCLGARTLEQQQANYRFATEAIPTEFWAALRDSGLIADWAPTPA